MLVVRRTCRSIIATAIVAGALVSMATPLAAQATASEKAAAEALFDAGLSLMREGKYPEACEKLEQSQAIESGIGTQLYLAECYAKTGRNASAWATFREAASAAAAQGQTQRAAQATQRAEELKPKLAYLVVRVAAETTALESVEVHHNQRALLPELWGVAVPVDPGEHAVTASAPGHQLWSGTIVVPEVASVTLDVPALKPEPVAMTAPSVTTVAHGDHDSDPGSTYRLVGWVVGGVGVVTLGVGTYYGIRAATKNADAEASGCRGQFCDSPQGMTLTTEALTAASLSNLFVTGGLALMATGVVLHLLAPSASERPANFHVAASLSPDGSQGNVVLRGAF